MSQSTEQNATPPVTAPHVPPAAPDAVTTVPPAAKADDNLMSQPPGKS